MKADAHVRGRELIIITARVQTKSIQLGTREKKKLNQFVNIYLAIHLHLSDSKDKRDNIHG